MQSNSSEKDQPSRHIKRLPPKAVVIFFCFALILGLSRLSRSSTLSLLAPVVQNVQASDLVAAASSSADQSSETMTVLEASSDNPQSASGTGLPALPPIDGDVLSSDLAAATQVSGIDAPNTQVSMYTVQSDDTLSSIADTFDISIDTIKQANGLTSASIHPGQTLVILPVTGVLYTVASNDTLSGISKKFGVDTSDILTYNSTLTASSVITKGELLVIPHGKLSISQATSYVSSQRSKAPSFEPLLDPVWDWPTAPAGYYVCPVPGARLTQGLHGHNAVDLAIAYGTPIHASAAGTVIVAKSNGMWNGGYGDFVMISHSNGSETLYAHMSRVVAKDGSQVAQGETIGYVGMTGLTTGPHVHFEIRDARNPFVDSSLCQ